MSLKYSILFALCLIWSGSALEILSPPEFAGITFLTPRLTLFGPEDFEFDITAPLVLYNNSNLENSIIIFDSPKYPELLATIDRVGSIVGVITFSGFGPVDIPGINSYVVEYGFFPDVMTPIVQASPPRLAQLTQYLVDGYNITVRITSGDVNPWDEMMNSGAMIAFSVILSAFTMACLVLAVYKFAVFAKIKGCRHGEFTVTQTMLVLEIVGNTIRFLSVAVDPMMSRRIFPFMLNNLLITPHWPFLIMNLMLVSLYWHELMGKNTVKINRNLKKFKKPFWAVFAVFLALELTQSILRGVSFPITFFLIVIGVFYVLVGLACIIFYYITGVKLTRTRKDAKVEVSHGRAKRLARATAFIYTSTAGVIIWLVDIVVAGLTDTIWYPWGYYAVWFVSFTATTFVSLMILLTVQEPRPCGALSSIDESNTRGQTSSVSSLEHVKTPKLK
jgi:hypothetical protein